MEGGRALDLSYYPRGRWRRHERVTVRFEMTAVAPFASPLLWAVTAAPTRIGFSHAIPSNPLAVVEVSWLPSSLQFTPSVPE